MALTKQARVLTDKQVRNASARMSDYRYGKRNLAILQLTLLAGLRAKEVASLRWRHLLDAEGDVGTAIRLTDEATKGRSGGVIPLNNTLRATLQGLLKAQGRVPGDEPVIRSATDSPLRRQSVVNFLAAHYRRCDIEGASSHSGRRTFITNAARQISTVGGSMRDVMSLARHANLQTTQRYVEQNSEAQERVVQLVG